MSIDVVRYERTRDTLSASVHTSSTILRSKNDIGELTQLQHVPFLDTTSLAELAVQKVDSGISRGEEARDVDSMSPTSPSPANLGDITMGIWHVTW